MGLAVVTNSECEITPKVGGNQTCSEESEVVISAALLFPTASSWVTVLRGSTKTDVFDLFEEKTRLRELWILDWETKNTQTVRDNQLVTTET